MKRPEAKLTYCTRTRDPNARVSSTRCHVTSLRLTTALWDPLTTVVMQIEYLAACGINTSIVFRIWTLKRRDMSSSKVKEIREDLAKIISRKHIWLQSKDCRSTYFLEIHESLTQKCLQTYTVTIRVSEVHLTSMDPQSQYIAGEMTIYLDA